MATFKKRTSLSGLSGSKWMSWAIARTGVNMPNCMTYATARISEILGRKEYLDDPKVFGAQELWTKYSEGFRRSKYAVPGALMIWQYGMYGHVAVCEDLINANTVAWSQSNYKGTEFEYIKGNPNGYKGMTFLGYLVHDLLPKAEESKPTPKPGPKEPDQILSKGSVVKSVKMGIKAGIKNIDKVDCVNVPALGGWFPMKYLDEADASDGKLDQYLSNDRAKVRIQQTTVQRVDAVNNLAMIHGIWVDPTPLIEIKDGK